jgi:hypothetical protein
MESNMTYLTSKKLSELRELIEDQMFSETCTNEQLCVYEDMFILVQQAIDSLELGSFVA